MYRLQRQVMMMMGSLLCGVVACTADSNGSRGGGDDLVTCGAPAVSDGGAGESGADTGADAVAGSAGCVPSQPILTCDVTNARDLGGTPLGNGRSVACGVLFRGPPLASLSGRGCQDVAALGIRTVIDLRTASERENVPEATCVRDAANFVLAPMPVPYNVNVTDYLADLNATSSVAAVFQALGDPAAYPAYVHCTWGRDRTGVMSAVILLALGATRSTVMDEYLLSEKTVGAYPSSLAGVLDDIDRRGGIEAYLTEAGVSADHLATLRARAIAAP